MFKIKSYKATFKRTMYNFISTFIHQLVINNLFQRIKPINKNTKCLFTLDLHTSVVRDFTPILGNLNVIVNRWSISGSSYLFKEPKLRIKVINNSTWKNLNSNMVNSFQKQYSVFLNKQNGFIISYTLSFIELFKKYKRPILGINATRYESPFTFNNDLFLDLNSSLQNYSNLRLISNNIGDRDYLKYFTGLDSEYIPSLCDYTVFNKPEEHVWVINCRNRDLARKISTYSVNLKTSHETWPNGYSYKQLSMVKGIVLIPYTISTMAMFELTTAGFPIRIPSDRLLLKMISWPGVLDELSYAQIYNREVLQINLNSPMDPGWSKFYNWWLERADWNNSEYFPNVTRFDSFEELAVDPKPFKIEAIFDRNIRISELWKNNLGKFAASL
jgi:hypothetical protein